MAKKFWWPSILAMQLVLVQNFLAKIGGYAATLPLTAGQILEIEAICEAIINTMQYADQVKDSSRATTTWRDDVFYGEPTGTSASPAPAFSAAPAPGPMRGAVTLFFEFRDLIVALPGYTDSIGEDLGIVGSEIGPKPEDEVAPALKPTVQSGYWVNVSGSMQGMDGMRIEYQPKGGNYSTIAYFTNTPGSFQITPATPGEPESGRLRAVFLKKNAEYGEFSPEYPVTVY